MTRLFSVSIALLNVASAAGATPPPPPAAHTWIRLAWQCPGRERSSVEIERFAEGESGYRTKVIGLVIAGRKVNPATVQGFGALVARRNFVRPVGGYCERNGEVVGIEELASGPKAHEAGQRDLFIPYAAEPKK